MDRFKGTNWGGGGMGRAQSYQNQAGSKLRERVCQTGAVVAEETSLGTGFHAWQQKT